MATEDGNVDPELVAPVEEDVFALTGVSLEDLLNPSKVVNYERERIILRKQTEETTDASERAELEARLNKVEKQIYSEKRTDFCGWFKNVIVGQALIALVLSGVAVYDAFLWFTISLRALYFWSYWLFTIPSLQARRPRGWEKLALNYAFLGSPIVTLGLPFLTKDPPRIWLASVAVLAACYAYGFAFSRGKDAEQAGLFTGALSALDFGRGQERGVRGAARERLFAKSAKAAADTKSADPSAAPVAAGEFDEEPQIGVVYVV